MLKVLDNASFQKVFAPDRALEREREMFSRVCSDAGNFECELWSTEQCLIAPRSLARARNFESALAASRSRGWPVYLRESGGDIVLQGRGVLNVSLAYASKAGEHVTINAAYLALVEPIVDELCSMGLQASIGSVAGSFCDGKYNVVVDGVKVAGTAQRWRQIAREPARYGVLSHALILIDADIEGGVRAVNGLKEACGQTGDFRADAHANLAALGARISEPQMFAEFADKLKRRYHARIVE